MKKSKVLSYAIAAFTALSIVAAGTYAWFTVSKESQALNVTAGTIDACVSAFSKPAENLLPGEVHVLDLHPTSIQNSGTRDMICEFTIGDVSKAALKDGKVPTDELKGEYILDNGKWYLSKDRLMTVAEFSMIDMMSSYPWKIIEGKYYARINAGQAYFVGRGQVKMLGELGGNVKDSSGNSTPNRLFEHEMSLSVANSILGVQNTKEACAEIFGEKIAAEFPNEWFD